MRVRAPVIAFAFIILVLLTPWVQVAADKSDGTMVNLTSDPQFAEVNDPINVANATGDQTVIGEWQRDLGDDMPNGTYFGSLLPPMKFQHNVAPSWWPEQVERYLGDMKVHTVSDADTGRFTYAMIAGAFNFSHQTIMAGATEWWVRAPIDPVSIEASGGLVVSMFEGEYNTSELELYDGYNNQASGRYYEWVSPRPTIDGKVPEIYTPFTPNGDWNYLHEIAGLPMTSVWEHESMRMINGHLYLRMDAVLRPETSYVLAFTFRLPNQGSLYTYWSQAERPTNNTSIVKLFEVEIAGEDDVGDEGDVTVLDDVEMKIDLDMDFSFIFVEGIGYGGMFGKKLEVTQGSTLLVYPFFNTSRSGSQYPSFALPFISNDNVSIHPQIHQGSGSSPGDSRHTWYFNAAGGEGSWDLYYFNPSVYGSTTLTETAKKDNASCTVTSTANLYIGQRVFLDDDDSVAEDNIVIGIDGDEVYFLYNITHKYSPGQNAILYFWTDAYYEYRDFILFSSNRTLDWATFDDDDRWNVAVYYTFNATSNITLLCYESDRPQVDWEDLSDTRWNMSLNPWGRPSFGDPYYTPGSRGQVAWMNYEVWCSARGTTGQWTVVDTDSDGKVTYNYHFPQRIELSSAQWVIKNDTQEWEYTFQEYWARAVEYWDQERYMKAIYNGARAVIQFALFDAGDMIWGWITDGVTRVIDKLKEWGNVIKTRIMEFVGWIKDIVKQAVDTILGWWSSFKYMIAPMVMIAFIGLTSKVAAWLFMGREKGVKA